MISVDDKIKTAVEMCRGIWAFDIDNMFKYLYSFTTENIAGYLPYFDLKDKSLLTVGSSIDQVMNAILMDSKDITVVDLCMFVKEYFNLKKAAIVSLSRQDFLKFFCYYYYNGKRTNHYAFNKNSYKVLRDALGSFDSESLYFWDYLFYYYRPVKVRQRLFNYDESRFDRITSYDEYLKSDIAYGDLRNKIDEAKVNFDVGNVADIKYDRGFDNIFLSNINAYCNYKKFKTIIDNMVKYLNDDGKMLAAYLYFTDISNLAKGIDENQINDLNLMIKLFPDNVDLYSFVGTRGIILHDDTIKDSIITYKKVKKI